MDYITLRDFWYAAILSVTLVAVILLVVAIYQFLIEPGRKRRKVSRRVKEGYQEQFQRIQILKERLDGKAGWWPKFLKILLGEKRLIKLRTRMLQADLHQDPGTLLRIVLCLVGAGFLAGAWGFKNPLAGLFLGCGLGIIPFFYLRWKRQGKTRQFETQMPDAMELLARSLRAGHTLPSALELIGEEMDHPMGTEMGIAYEEQQFGISTPDALLHMLERVESMDLRYFVAAVLIQQETGGNLAELMENIARVIRSRLNFKSKVRSLTAMGRITVTILIVTPIIAFFGLMAVASQYEKALVFTAMGRIMLMGGIFLVLVGGLALKKIINAVEA
jgi:tight adherence protein B